MLESKFDKQSLFGQLDFFYGKLIGSIKEKNPSIFKKGNVLHEWHFKIGKTFEEFRNNEIRRWQQNSSHLERYERRELLNGNLFDV